MKKLIFLAIAATIILASLMSGCFGEEDEEEEEQLEEAPNFTLTDVDGGTFKLSAQSGKVVILDFMHIDCPPCRVEMGHLEDVYDNYSSSPVVIISIDVRFDSENETELREFRDDNGYQWTFAMDTETKDVRSKYEVSAFPTMVIVNKEGKIAYDYLVGLTDYETLSSKIDELL